ncbi:BQ5605_C018g08759 [Microbotryum silenes-dioicae]|uniref:BQ5605_C018g08759 protein n=1 Tax=Microbotryum silenes-dioicae TaxID=796604 RepID=A0A2X0M0W7_9BASI|nr:BQ5605_C018g08759 [Microbotryum silenes-dioicae]
MTALQTYPGQQWSSFLFKLSEFRVETWLGLTLVVYVIVSYLGRRANTYVARNVMLAVAPALREEFAGVGFNDHLFVLDGGDSVKSYATGRRAFDWAWIQVKLPSRQDPLFYLNHLRAIFDHTYQPKTDRFTLECELSEPSGFFCLAILDRRVLRTTRERWDMLTFTCVSERTNVDPSLIILTESGDINSALLRDPANNIFGDVFAPGSQCLRYFESLVITDSGGSAPGDIAFRLPDKNLRIELALRLPPTSHLQELAPWVNLVCDLGDLLHSKQNLVPKMAVTKGASHHLPKCL